VLPTCPNDRDRPHLGTDYIDASSSLASRATIGMPISSAVAIDC
jgi:hypothetical protein